MPAPDESPAIRFQILGPVRMWRGDQELDLHPRQRRTMLALLLALAGRPASNAEIVDLLWEHDPPAQATNALHRHVGVLRRQWEPTLASRASGRWLLRNGDGYQMAVDPTSLDLLRFRDLVAAARRSDDDTALDAYGRALACWQGPAAANLDPVVRAHPAFSALDREYAATVREFAGHALRHGRPRDALPALTDAVDRDPFDESLQADLIRVLGASGQQAAAVSRYHDVRRRLADELGVDPGAELRDAFAHVLRQEDAAPAASGVARVPLTPVGLPAVGTPAVGTPGTGASIGDTSATPDPDWPRPAQLPPAAPFFTGREDVLASLREVLADAPRWQRASPVLAVDGMPGVGKTTLVLRLAHDVAAAYPDGQLFLNLRGFDPNHAVVTPEEALRDLLSGLGVGQGDIPAGRQAMAGLYRSRLSGRRVLIVLDNVRDADQVVDLLPGTAGSLAVVTSRRALARLRTTAGAHLVRLQVPSPAEARAHLVAHFGAGRTAADGAVIDALVDRCGRLPLALAVVATRAAVHPDFSLDDLLEDLGTSGSLDFFDRGELSDGIRTIFSSSYRMLSGPASRLFRLLSLHPVGDATTVSAAASLGGLPPRAAAVLIDELTGAGLLTEVKPGRLTWHDLIRDYALELRDQLEPDEEQRRALDRLYNHYWLSAYRASQFYRPLIDSDFTIEALPGVTTPTFDDQLAALAWFDRERHTLAAVIRHAAENGRPGVAWRLALTLLPYQQRRALWQDWLEIATVVHAAAVGSGDRRGEAHTLRSLAGAKHFLHHYDEAQALLERSCEIFQDLGMDREYAHALGNLAMVHLRQGRPELAVRHAGQSLELVRGTGDERGEATALWAIAAGQIELGTPAGTMETIRECIEISRRLGDTIGEASAVALLSDVLHREGDRDEAIKWRLRSIMLEHESGSPVREAGGYRDLGDDYLAAGDPDAAREAWTTAIALLSDDDAPLAGDVRGRLDGLLEAASPRPAG